MGESQPGDSERVLLISCGLNSGAPPSAVPLGWEPHQRKWRAVLTEARAPCLSPLSSGKGRLREMHLL